MSWSPSDSAIKVTPSLEERLAKATSAEIPEILKQAAVDQGLATRAWDPSILEPVEPGTRPRAYAKAVVLNGVKHIIEGATEQEMLANENEFYRTQVAQPAAAAATEQHRDDAGRFVAAKSAEEQAADAVAKADLDMAFRLGTITTEDYLARSGAISEYLEKQGIPLEDLKASVADKSAQRFEQSWASATAQFLATHSDWPGGQENMRKVGELLKQMDAVDEPSAENLAIAYQWLKDNGQLVANPEIEAANRVASARSVEEIREAVRPGSSGFFSGR